MKKMFLALSLLAVAPIFAEEAVTPATPAATTVVAQVEGKSYLAQAKDAVANCYTYVSDAVEKAGSYIPGNSYFSDYVVTPARNNVKVAMVVVAVVTAAVVNGSQDSVEAELE